MNLQELTVTCLYSKDETDIVPIIQSSFETFLKRELHGIANSPCRTI